MTWELGGQCSGPQRVSAKPLACATHSMYPTNSGCWSLPFLPAENLGQLGTDRQMCPLSQEKCKGRHCPGQQALSDSLWGHNAGGMVGGMQCLGSSGRPPWESGQGPPGLHDWAAWSEPERGWQHGGQGEAEGTGRGTFQALLGVGGEAPVPELVMQEPDDGVGQALLVIHFEVGRDDALAFSGSARLSQAQEDLSAAFLPAPVCRLQTPATRPRLAPGSQLTGPCYLHK